MRLCYKVETVSEKPLTLRVTVGENSRFIGSVTQRAVCNGTLYRPRKEYVWQACDVYGVLRFVEDTCEAALQRLFDKSHITVTSPILTQQGVGAVSGTIFQSEE